MPKTHIENAPRFNTLLRERLYHLWCATLHDGKLTVDLKRHPPSNRGIIPQMIAQGLFDKKRGSTVTLTEKGRAYMKRHGEAAYQPSQPTDLTGLTDEERDLLAVLDVLFLAEAASVRADRLWEPWALLIKRGFFELVPHTYGWPHVRFRPTPAMRSLVAGMSDKRIRAMIDTCQDPVARKEYGKRGFTETLALIDSHMAWPSTLPRKLFGVWVGKREWL